MHDSYLGIKETPVLSVMRRVSFGNKQMLDIYAEIEPDMSVSDRLNKEKWHIPIWRWMKMVLYSTAIIR